MIYGPYKAVVVGNHDGDTISLDIDLGFGTFLRAQTFDGKPLLSCRLFGINAPELNTSDGRIAQDALAKIAPPGSHVTVVSHGWDKYGGRFDGEVQLSDGTDLSEYMVKNGYAKEVSY